MTEHDLTNESHRAACSECTATWAELDAISAEARVLPRLTPSRDLWAGIEARIDANVTSSGTALGRAERRWFRAPVLRMAAAAAVLVVASSAVTWRVATDRIDSSPSDVATGMSDSAAAVRAALTEAPAGSPRYTQASYESDFAAMDAEIRTMQALLNERRAELDPSTIAVLERSLTLIDQAIGESRAALLNDPASQFLAAQLARSYSTKLTLLRATATMPVGD
ncbi:MAG: hypothetical protein K8S21_11975 [Gemmatimonadetes bacterium]|nr:hypothetical protein [Gemmatimonadota bacterium]